MATDAGDSSEALVQANPQLKSYYESLESRIGYRLLLGGTRHFGYYEDGAKWPFPIGRALRAMEERLFRALDLPEGSQVLDAGCGVAHVAMYMARRGLRITGIDIIDHHITKAKRNIARSGLPPGQVTVQKMDYQHLESIPDQSHDGVYTMETFVHATDPEKALAGFYRILRPGGRLVLFEYDHNMGVEEHIPKHVVDDMNKVNKDAAMPTNARSHKGVFTRMLEDAGFTDVRVEDYSKNIRPMLWLFYVKFLHLERYFINTVAGAQGYLHQEHWRYVAISATKPGERIESAKTK
jgi:cyclopropane fatty-acyl-phospholipid synthase-like methyltransferase